MATVDVDALKFAKDLQDTQDRLFWDNQHGGYFYSQANSANVVVRLKEDHDGAEPCGNSVAARNLLYISAYFHDKSYKERACKLLQFFSSTTPFGYALPEMFSAQVLLADSLAMMVIVGMCATLYKYFSIFFKYLDIKNYTNNLFLLCVCAMFLLSPYFRAQMRSAQ